MTTTGDVLKLAYIEVCMSNQLLFIAVFVILLFSVEPRKT